MREAPSPHLAAVDDLRIGMFIHLEGGWLAHPFPLSNFKISAPQQIATIRSLGLKSVRWSPDKSDLETPTGSFATPEQRAARADPDAAAPSAAGAAATVAKASPGPAEVSAGAPSAGRESVVERRQRIALAAQRDALQRCQQQFVEANLACKTLTEMVMNRPRVAREQSEALSRALVEKMLGQGESCIRLLSEVAGDKASAHAVNVTVLSLLLGKTFGLSQEDMQDLGVGAMLHDVGKLDLPERLRHREDHFSPSEALYYQEHVAHGASHARRMGLSEGAQRVVEQHHEHADGTGFPLRLASDRMTVGARIVALVNRYDNLCNPNVPSRALTPHESLSLLFAQGKTKFDAAIMGAFIKMMGVYPPGSAVQLTDERFAIVVAVNSNRPLKPRVLVHDAAVAAKDALLLDLEAEPRLGIRRSLKPLALPRAALEYLSPRPRMAYFFEPAHELAAEAIG